MYTQLYKGESWKNTCLFFATLNCMRTDSQRRALCFEDLDDPPREFIRLVGERWGFTKKVKTGRHKGEPAPPHEGYTKEMMIFYLDYLVKKEKIRCYTFESVDPWPRVPHFFVSHQHEEEESFVLVGRSPRSDQKAKVLKAIKKAKTKERWYNKNHHKHRGGKGHHLGSKKQRAASEQKSVNLAVDAWSKVTRSMVKRDKKRRNSHAVAVRFVAPLVGYPVRKDWRPGLKVPYLYDTKMVRGRPLVEAEELAGVIYGIWDIFRVSITV